MFKITIKYKKTVVKIEEGTAEVSDSYKANIKVREALDALEQISEGNIKSEEAIEEITSFLSKNQHLESGEVEKSIEAKENFDWEITQKSLYIKIKITSI